MTRDNLYMFIVFVLISVPNAVTNELLDPKEHWVKFLVFISTCLNLYMQKLGNDLNPHKKPAPEDAQAVVVEIKKQVEAPEEPGK